MVKEAIEETNATSMKDMGKVIALVNSKANGRTDGKTRRKGVLDCGQIAEAMPSNQPFFGLFLTGGQSVYTQDRPAPAPSRARKP